MLKLENIKKSYGDLNVIEDMSLYVSSNEIVGLVGPSGCGKTTLLNMISGHDKDYMGSIENSFKKISYVFQEDRLLPWCTVIENIRVVNEDISDTQLMHLLDTMELLEFKNSYPKELSGGLRQRVSIARAFAFNGDLLLMDEPFKSLDQKLKESLLSSLIKLFHQTAPAIILVTHDFSEAAILCDKIVLLTERPCSIIEIIENPGDKDERLGNQGLLDTRITEIRRKMGN